MMEEKNIDIKEIKMENVVMNMQKDSFIENDVLDVKTNTNNQSIQVEKSIINDESSNSIDNDNSNNKNIVFPSDNEIENKKDSEEFSHKEEDKILVKEEAIDSKVKEIQNLNNEIQTKMDKLGKLDDEVQSKNNELDEILKDFDDLEKEKGKLQEDANEIKGIIKNLELKKSGLIEEQNKINQEIKKQNNEKEYNQKLLDDANKESLNIINNAKLAANNITEGVNDLVKELIDKFKQEYNSIIAKVYDEKDSLTKREIDVAAKEENAIKGFVDQVNKKLKELATINNDLAEKKFNIDKEVNKYREDKYKEVNVEVDSIKNAIKVEHDKLVDFLSDYKETEQKYLEQFAEIENQRRTLERQKYYYIAREKSLDKEISEKVEAIDSDKEQQILDLIEQQKEAVKDNINLRNTNNRLRIENAKLNNLRDLDIVNKELSEQNSKLIEKINDLESRHLLNSDDELKIQEYNHLYEVNEDLRNQIKDLKLVQSRNTFSEKENNELKDQIVRKDEVINNLKEDLDNYKNVPRSERIKAVEKEIKAFDDINKLDPFESDTTELEWLSHIKKQAEASGIIFSDRLLKAYHTSVKIGDWSPLVVLAGVSGTGKSELPRQYALHGGMNFLPIAVKPDWDSPQSLFGYYNSIENKFEATELLRALYQMQHSNKMAMILLDEMNLAHVELYFSDLLSKMETKRGAKDYVEYEIDLGASVESEILQIKDNILWTGTMNEDETTKALSDKVIDRSTLITFPRPTDLIGRSNCKNLEATQYLPIDLWEKWKHNAINIENKDVKNILSYYKKAVETINGTMSQLGRNLGHRVWQSIQYYIVNHPDVIANIKDPNKLQQSMKEAFVETIAFKIMPKLRGVETTGDYESIFNSLESEIAEFAGELAKDFHNARNLPSKIFMWHTAEFLK